MPGRSSLVSVDSAYLPRQADEAALLVRIVHPEGTIAICDSTFRIYDISVGYVGRGDWMKMQITSKQVARNLSKVIFRALERAEVEFGWGLVGRDRAVEYAGVQSYPLGDREIHKFAPCSDLLASEAQRLVAGGSHCYHQQHALDWCFCRFHVRQCFPKHRP